MAKVGRFYGFIFIVSFLVVCTMPAWALTDSISKKFDHKLGFGESSKSWEHRIDLPDDWAMKGLVFVKRTLALSDKLVIEREELKGNYYYVKVRLPKATLWTGKGSLRVELVGASQPGQESAPDAVTGLWVSGQSSIPTFKWNGLGKYSAITLLDRKTGKTVWERVILNGTKCEMDEGNCVVGHHYLWAVQQSDEYAKYSQEARGAFRVDTRWGPCHSCHGAGYEVCHSCNGSGWIWTNGGPNGQPIHTICHSCNGSGRIRCVWCHGTGKEQYPIIVPE